MERFPADSEGQETRCDGSLVWQEELSEGGGEIFVWEHWFLAEKSKLEQIRLYGIIHITDESVKGGWEVNFQLNSLSE